MTKVLSASDLAAVLTEQAERANLEALVMPTADDLLAITLAALDDVDPSLDFTSATKTALRAALRHRLTGHLGGFATDEDAV